jgi:heat shock protein HslJ
MIWRTMLSALILSLTARGGPGRPAVTDTPAPPPLEGTQWLLVSLNGRDPLPDTTFSLNFKDGQATGVSVTAGIPVPPQAVRLRIRAQSIICQIMGAV